MPRQPKKAAKSERESEEKLEEEVTTVSTNQTSTHWLTKLLEKLVQQLVVLAAVFLVNPHWAHMLVIILRIRAISYSKNNWLWRLQD